MKKKFVVLALVAMFVCGSAFARPPMYAGVEMGYSTIDSSAVVDKFSHFGAFELTPVFGIAPFSKLPDLALEFNFMMDFAKSKHTIATVENGKNTTKTYELKANIFTPQILAVYTFCDGPVRPFAGAGIGINFNTGKIDGEIETNTKYEDIKVKASFSLVTKAGVVANIANTGFDLLFLAKYNLNISKELSYVPVETEGNTTTRKDKVTVYGPFNFSALSFTLGGRYNF